MEQELFEKEMKKDIEKRRHTRLLKVEFSVKERLDLSEQMGSAYRNKAQAESELKTVQAQYGGKLKQFDAEIKNIMEKVNTRWEMRSVECEEVKDFRTGNVFSYRIDTGERIEERAMTAAERQGDLPLKEKEPEAPGDSPTGDASGVGEPDSSAVPGASGVEEGEVVDAEYGLLAGEGAEAEGILEGPFEPGSPDPLNEEPAAQEKAVPEEELPEDDNPFYKFYNKRKKK